MLSLSGLLLFAAAGTFLRFLKVPLLLIQCRPGQDLREGCVFPGTILYNQILRLFLFGCSCGRSSRAAGQAGTPGRPETAARCARISGRISGRDLIPAAALVLSWPPAGSLQLREIFQGSWPGRNAWKAGDGCTVRQDLRKKFRLFAWFRLWFRLLKTFQK